MPQYILQTLAKLLRRGLRLTDASGGPIQLELEGGDARVMELADTAEKAAAEVPEITGDEPKPEQQKADKYTPGASPPQSEREENHRSHRDDTRGKDEPRRSNDTPRDDQGKRDNRATTTRGHHDRGDRRTNDRGGHRGNAIDRKDDRGQHRRRDDSRDRRRDDSRSRSRRGDRRVQPCARPAPARQHTRRPQDQHKHGGKGRR